MVVPQKFTTSALRPRNRLQKASIFKLRRLILIFCSILLFTLLLRKSLFLLPNPPIDSTSEAGRSLAVLSQKKREKSTTIEKSPTSTLPERSSTTAVEEKLDTKVTVAETCKFRTYKPPRHYNLNESIESQPSFLSEAKYIRGKLPFVINPDLQGLQKICIDTSEWETEDNGRLPFSDGQNPSLVSIMDTSSKIGENNITPLEKIYGLERIKGMYLGLVLFGDAQCRWNLSQEELKAQNFSALQEPPTKRTLVVAFDENRIPVGHAVLELLHDAPWGETRKKLPPKPTSDGGFERSIKELDDARFFFHNGSLHVLYRNGPYFGYEEQVQHPVHIEAAGDGKFKAYIKASEVFQVCCGRNIAFISEIPNEKNNNKLMALTWVDPVSVIGIELSNDGKESEQARRRLRENIEESHIHGTNGYLLPLQSTSELLGIAHFHRPDNRKKNPYARFGHHYSHAFFTIQKKESAETDFVLKRLSNEFIFASPSAPDSTTTGDMIQFASGLDLIGTDTNGKLLISYGINDCESATFFLGMDVVHKLLQEVKDGKQVIDLMTNL